MATILKLFLLKVIKALEEKIYVMPFETFVSVCGERLSPCPYSQEYFFVEGFPSSEELRQMGVDMKHPLFQE